MPAPRRPGPRRPDPRRPASLAHPAHLQQLGVEEARREAAKLEVGRQHCGGGADEQRWVALGLLKGCHPLLVGQVVCGQAAGRSIPSKTVLPTYV